MVKGLVNHAYEASTKPERAGLGEPMLLLGEWSAETGGGNSASLP